MAKPPFATDIEKHALASIDVLQQNAYGMTIHEEVEKLMGGFRVVSLGSIYTTLDRLEAKGYVKSWFGGQTAERGGRSKRFFALTEDGETALKNAMQVAENVRELKLRPLEV